MMRISLAVVVISVLTSACHLVKIETRGTSVSKGQSSGSPTGEDGDREQRVLAAYQDFTYESCIDFNCAEKFEAKAGIHPYTDRARYGHLWNPRNTMKNPDPEWLPGWDS